MTIHLFAINKLNNENKLSKHTLVLIFLLGLFFYSPQNGIGKENYLINCIIIVSPFVSKKKRKVSPLNNWLRSR